MFSIRNILKLFIIIFIANHKNVESAKILGLFTSQSKSHLVIHFAVVRALVERGHNVTVVTTIPYKEPNLTGFRHLVLRSEYDYENAVKEMINVNSTYGTFTKTMNAIKTLIDISKNVTLTDEFQKLMREETFDLLLLGYIFNEFHLGLAAHFNCPVVVVWVQKPFYVIDRLVGSPVLSLDFSRINQMGLNIELGNGFLYRIFNFLLATLELTNDIVYYYLQKSHYEILFPFNKYPSYDTILQNVSLLLINNHYSEGLIRANVPALIEIGGIQVKSKPDPLPDDIAHFLNKSTEHGAILFSLGSNVKGEHLSDNATKTFYSVLSTLKQNVIWKWDSEKTPGNSKNILYKNWLPQDDILAHPNLRLFITHGGKGSLVEATYHGIPTIGIPLFADQPANVNEMAKKGFGVVVNIEKLTVESFKNAIDEVLTNHCYTKEVQKFSQLYRDRPMSSKNSATFWIEYVIRHKGAKHMQSPAVSMSVTQLLGLDVIGFLLGIMYVAYRLMKLVLKFLWRKCCGRKVLKMEQEKELKSKQE